MARAEGKVGGGPRAARSCVGIIRGVDYADFRATAALRRRAFARGAHFDVFPVRRDAQNPERTWSASGPAFARRHAFFGQDCRRSPQSAASARFDEVASSPRST